jgi:hypothetical protein
MPADTHWFDFSFALGSFNSQILAPAPPSATRPKFKRIRGMNMNGPLAVDTSVVKQQIFQ